MSDQGAQSAPPQPPPPPPPRPSSVSRFSFQAITDYIRGITPERKFPKLNRITLREYKEELRRDEKPPPPIVPLGWTVQHPEGSSVFTMFKRNGVEELHLSCQLEIKDPEKTYRWDDGERRENEHFNFTVLVTKPETAPNHAIEFALTSVDSELVLDAITVHSTKEDVDTALKRTLDAQTKRGLKYRGPSINELDEDFNDELLHYLEERGVHNAFAEFIAAQSHYIEQLEYESWLMMLNEFAVQKELEGAPSGTESTRQLH